MNSLTSCPVPYFGIFYSFKWLSTEQFSVLVSSMYNASLLPRSIQAYCLWSKQMVQHVYFRSRTGLLQPILSQANAINACDICSSAIQSNILFQFTLHHSKFSKVLKPLCCNACALHVVPPVLRCQPTPTYLNKAWCPSPSQNIPAYWLIYRPTDRGSLPSRIKFFSSSQSPGILWGPPSLIQLLPTIALKMEIASTSQTSVHIYQTT